MYNDVYRTPSILPVWIIYIYKYVYVVMHLHIPCEGGLFYYKTVIASITYTHADINTHTRRYKYTHTYINTHTQT